MAAAIVSESLTIILERNGTSGTLTLAGRQFQLTSGENGVRH